VAIVYSQRRRDGINRRKKMTTPSEKFAFLIIAVGLLLAGYMDGQDAAMAEKSSVVVACIQCGER
jgi:hypothetical protein